MDKPIKIMGTHKSDRTASKVKYSKKVSLRYEDLDGIISIFGN